MAPTFRGVIAVEGTTTLVVGVIKVDAVATEAMVVEESKAAWVPVVAMEFVVVVDKVKDVMTVVHATTVVEWVEDCNQGGGGCRGRLAKAATTIGISGHFAIDCPTSAMRK
ncbi:hypothetical protein S83_044176 [Arachis hypogaea]